MKPNTIFDALPTHLLWTWSNCKEPPKIGDVVMVNFNRLGYGIVSYYFVYDRYLGVGLTPKNPPDWWKKQNKDRKHYEVFGAEIVY